MFIQTCASDQTKINEQQKTIAVVDGAHGIVIQCQNSRFSRLRDTACILLGRKQIELGYMGSINNAFNDWKRAVNAEIWAVAAEAQRRLPVFEMVCVRKLTGVSRRDRIRNIRS